MASRAKALSAAEIEARAVRAARISALLDREYPEAKCALNYETPAQLLFATILSAQCTDVRVNLTTPALFAKYPGPAEMAAAKPGTLEKMIYSTGFYKNKAKSLIGAAKAIMHEHGGELPRTMEELTQLPGVGRKTANVVLGDAFGIQMGVVVDTHVRRLTNLMGLTEQQDPEKIEQELMEIVPKKHWTKFSHWLILHGRSTCIARRPNCEECPVRKYCDHGSRKDLT
jgi:endonuclease III